LICLVVLSVLACFAAAVRKHHDAIFILREHFSLHLQCYLPPHIHTDYGRDLGNSGSYSTDRHIRWRWFELNDVRKLEPV
jgi:hypothetical protein